MSFDGDLYPEAGATSVMTTKGDVVRYDSQRERYGIGATGKVLTVSSGGLPAWEDAGGSNMFYINGENDGASNNRDDFFGLFHSISWANSTTEGDVVSTLNNGFSIIRHQATFFSNTKNGDTVISFRDDGASSNSLTIGASTSGEFNSGAISVAVADDSECCWERDATASSSGTNYYTEFITCQV
ncbi:MAG: hypothetical protein CMB80_03110 [Flammeovirgaceae bacterium]|nr:hypothetical protein [Flammeovirgaceae bacterium]